MRQRRFVLSAITLSLILGVATRLVAGEEAGRLRSDPIRPLALGDSNTQLVYTPVAPCRIIDTRVAGGSLVVGASRPLRVTGSDLSSQGGSSIGCNVPFGRTTAAVINFVAVTPAGAGNLRAWAYRMPPSAPPNSSVLNYAFVAGAGLNIANAVIIPTCDLTESGQTCPYDFRAQADGSGTHLVADVVGFFERFPTEEVSGLAVAVGTIIIWDQSSQCPAGYTRAGSLDGRFPRGASAVGGTGGGAVHTHSTSHGHGMVNHTHGGTTGGQSASTDAYVPPAGLAPAHNHTFTTGGPSANVTDGPSTTTSGSAPSLPPYFDVLLCRKTAPPSGESSATGSPQIPRPLAPSLSKRAAMAPLALGDSNAHLVYTPVAPCRIIDTRVAGGSLAAGAPRPFLVTGIDLSAQGGSSTGCNVPFGRATAAFVNFVAVNPVGAGNLRAWAYRTPPPAPPNSSVLNYAFVSGAGLNIANGLAIPICAPTEPGQACPFDVRVQADGSGTHLVADVIGFFERFPTEDIPGLAIPTDAVVIWDQSSECPAGYMRAGSFDGRFLRGASTAGAAGGADTHNHDTLHTHGMGNHTHGGTTNPLSGSPHIGSEADTGAAHGHTHAFTTGGPSPNVTDPSSTPTSGSAPNLPPYLDVLFCRKMGTASAKPSAKWIADKPLGTAASMTRERAGPLALGDSNAQLVYTTVTPCRIIDTRLAGGGLAVGVPRLFGVAGIDLSAQGGSSAGCNIPFGRATAAFVNLVAVNPLGAGNLRAWAYRAPPLPLPNSSVLNYAFVAGSGLNIANGIAIPICDPSQSGQTCPFDLGVQADGNSTHLVADVVGFFERLPVEELPSLAVPTGAVVAWDQSDECPAGYTRVKAFDGRFLRGAATVGGAGGADTHTHDISHTHGMGNHAHGGTTNPNASFVQAGAVEPDIFTAAYRVHTHALMTVGPSSNATEGPSPPATGSVSNQPPYFDILFCRKS